jgi:hypothetical protein
MQCGCSLHAVVGLGAPPGFEYLLVVAAVTLSLCYMLSSELLVYPFNFVDPVLSMIGCTYASLYHRTNCMLLHSRVLWRPEDDAW